MEFDKSRIYTTVNADELKVGSKIIVADTLDDLKMYVRHNSKDVTLTNIASECHISRFGVGLYTFNLAYLVSEHEEKKLKWTDLKVGDVIRNGDFTHLVTGIHNFEQTDKHIFVNGCWIYDYALEDWEKVEE